MGTTAAGIPRGWKSLLDYYRGNGLNFNGNTAVVKLNKSHKAFCTPMNKDRAALGLQHPH